MKKLLVIAVAAALAAPAAMADTTLYGKLHASVNSTAATSAAGVKTTDTTTNSNASRFGIKGSTALDNGMEATYGLEYGIQLDGQYNPGGNGVTFGRLNSLAIDTRTDLPAFGETMTPRNTFVGLKGKFGEVRVGRHDTPAKLATAGLDQFADTGLDMNNIIVADGERVDNAVAYINKFGPVTVAAAHSTGVSTNDLTETNSAAPLAIGDANSVMAVYGNGPWTASLGHTSVANFRSNTNVGLGWKSEAGHNVGLVYETNKAKSNPTTQAALNVLGGTTFDTGYKDTNIYLGGGYKMGNMTLKAAVGTGKRAGNTTVTANNGKEKFTAIGLDYSLGKKTSVYAALGEDKNPNRVTGVASQQKTKTTTVGLVTEF